MLHEGGDALNEILTTEQVSLIRQDALTTSIKCIEQLCDSHEKLRMQLAEAEAEFQHQLAEALRLEDERVRWADACTGWALEMQEMEADLRALAKAAKRPLDDMDKYHCWPPGQQSAQDHIPYYHLRCLIGRL